MAMPANDLLEHLWLPYTQMKTARQPLKAVSTQGALIRIADGHELIDGIASWWTACHGYNHPHILAALREQLERMPHVMFGGLVHEPALKLAARLAEKTPGDLNHVFFVDSGSVAVEVAMKMAVQYWLNQGRSRPRMVSFRYGYHGDTMACMSVCDPDESMHSLFKDYLPKQILAELPVDEASEQAFDDLLAREKEKIAAVLIEPLVQGAGGMKFHAPETLRRVADACARQGVLLIADEIFVGFGRTGTLFACEQAGVTPDILCLGKGLTGGALSLAATLARPHVYEAFLSDDPARALMHGPTFMANPLACAAANASLDLFEIEPRLEQVARIESLLREGLAPCAKIPGVLDVRVKGAIGAVQCATLGDAASLRATFAEQGLWIRPFGDIVYLTPAFTIAEVQLAALTSGICSTLPGWLSRS
ncbi:adenosylmethionine--8-amino-7-oxononanoate transaminase [Rhodoblastus acidophilus]|uniref:Adenosylmethionine-8-amino-7-oxononanoate aminotransferase n=1 Tax=Candidatus Rhodoblastus alkanivorans TaxID=2954117 RepID=A0ABS9Z6J9_9HYPH|nr:adenosylmethionine--8-amino-7-oxononanoate transaminase [Candidatus Rhodoblastus alkanivorans]MCI4679558.1 adenosylmethionine--8-amino-7-oxononanoate transaminase [Candidatus Rhodoblastus alkanivorans]MCI4683309.1 adenosylmethionine--8-amino-7-oxononanoate transaminase [Candidatus Rhodoblastus alkanivorans]MDI4640622.1 adenosylmethionine--8-amino-7-oxononanoate transaminase [Rhodoblastus acidophilus]